MHSKEQEAVNAAKICDAGWRQGAVLDPRTAGIAVPANINILPNEYLIICTQSCSVVSPRFAADPFIELMVAKPLSKFKDNAPEATGKNVRKLHIPLIKPEEFIALECDLNRRFQHERSVLLDKNLMDVFDIGEKGANKLAAWIGRSYTRIALPNKLVANMRVELLGKLSRALETPYGDQADPIHYQVPYIYIRWTPVEEEAEIYILDFLFICSEYGAANVLEDEIALSFKNFLSALGNDGISIQSFKCQEAGETFLTDLDGFERFSEWDYLSNLAEVGDVRE